MQKLTEVSPTTKTAQEPMEDWANKAWVKKQRIAYGLPETVDNRVMFSPKLVPVLSHPDVLERGEQFVGEVLTQKLYNYVDFTAKLERGAVNIVTRRIADKSFWTPLSAHMYRGAGRIYTDEAFHAQESDEILQALVDDSGVPPVYTGRPRFMKNLHTLRHRLEPRKEAIAMSGFAIVSETLISSFLAEIPNDPFVIPSVRDFVREHAKDEGRHHAYFSQLLTYGWPKLSAPDRAFLGPLLPQFVHWFLDPDLAWLEAFLKAKGFTPAATRRIIAESHPQAAVELSIRKAARHSVARFRAEGVLEDAATADAFAAAGLLDDAA